jgi:hypothetical protein
LWLLLLRRGRWILLSHHLQRLFGANLAHLSAWLGSSSVWINESWLRCLLLWCGRLLSLYLLWLHLLAGDWLELRGESRVRGQNGLHGDGTWLRRRCKGSLLHRRSGKRSQGLGLFGHRSSLGGAHWCLWLSSWQHRLTYVLSDLCGGNCHHIYLRGLLKRSCRLHDGQGLLQVAGQSSLRCLLLRHDLGPHRNALAGRQSRRLLAQGLGLLGWLGHCRLCWDLRSVQ